MCSEECRFCLRLRPETFENGGKAIIFCRSDVVVTGR